MIMQLVAVEFGKELRWKVDRDDTRSLCKRTIIFSGPLKKAL
jgi:hypothetical protein